MIAEVRLCSAGRADLSAFEVIFGAAQDDDIKVIILAGAGPHFSAGHDLRAGPENFGGFKTPVLHTGARFAWCYIATDRAGISNRICSRSSDRQPKIASEQMMYITTNEEIGML